MMRKKSGLRPTVGGIFAVLAIILAGGSLAEAAPRQDSSIFKVGNRTFQGRPEVICAIEGTWADGAPFRYEGWDMCAKMRLRAVTEKDYRGAPSLGEDDDFTVADIPRRSEVIEITNGVSTTIVFRDRDGKQREILTRD